MKVLWLSRDDVRRAGGGDPLAAMPLIESALATHASGDVCQPLKPYLTIPNDDQARRIIAMPAYLGDSFQTWGLKWIASAPENPAKRGIERASAVIILNDLDTGRPLVIMEGALISATRTAAVALVAAKYLVRPQPRMLSCLGAGFIGSLIVRSLISAHPSLKRVKLFDQIPSQAEKLARALEAESHVEAVQVVDGPQAALRQSDLIVTATTAQEGYLEGSWLDPGTLFLNVSLRDPRFSLVERADKIVVDDWEQINRSNTIIHQMTQAGRLSRQDIHGELSDVVGGRATGRESDAEIIMFNPMGLAIEDIATAWGVYRMAKSNGLGTELEFNS